MAWIVEYDPEVERDLRKLDPSIQREILDYMDNRIATESDLRRFGKPLRHSKYGLWRYRVRDHRIICEIQAKRLVVLCGSSGAPEKRLRVSCRISPVGPRAHIRYDRTRLGFVRQGGSLRWDLEPRFQLFGFSRTAALPEE